MAQGTTGKMVWGLELLVMIVGLELLVMILYIISHAR